MLLTLLALGCILLGFFLYFKYESINYIIEAISMFMIVVGIICSITFGIIIMIAHFDVDNQIMMAKMERESILLQINALTDNTENVSEIEVIQEVYDWNEDVIADKTLVENPWISWFFSKRYIDTLEMINWED